MPVVAVQTTAQAHHHYDVSSVLYYILHTNYLYRI